MYITKEYIKNRMINLKESIDFSNEEQSTATKKETRKEDILNAQQGIMKYVIKFLLKYKHIIKKIPVIGKYLVYKKRKMYEDAYGEISIYKILKLEPYDFLKELYKIALNREIDVEGLINHMEEYNNYATNEAIAYEVFISSEFNERTTVENIKVYQKAHRKYIIKKKVYNLMPVKILMTVLFSIPIVKRKNMLIRNLQKSLVDLKGVYK